jgi:hypothetical protein
MTPSGARDAIFDSDISISSQSKKLLRDDSVPVTPLLCMLFACGSTLGKASFSFAFPWPEASG